MIIAIISPIIHGKYPTKKLYKSLEIPKMVFILRLLDVSIPRILPLILIPNIIIKMVNYNYFFRHLIQNLILL